MGYVKDVLKGGANTALNHIKSYDVGGQLKSSINSMGINVPKLNIDPGRINGVKVDLNDLKLPAGMDSYISPIISKATSGISLSIPSSIGGVPLPKIPELPDLSSVSKEVDGYLSTHNLDTEKLGIGSVDEILQTPDLSSLKNVEFEVPTTFEFPDLMSSIDKFDMVETQNKVDELASLSTSELQNLDLSKYF